MAGLLDTLDDLALLIARAEKLVKDRSGSASLGIGSRLRSNRTGGGNLN